MQINRDIRHPRNGQYLLGWEEISAAAVARIIGKNSRFVRDVLTGGAGASIGTYQQLAKVLNVSLDALMQRISDSRTLNQTPKASKEYADLLSKRVSTVRRHAHNQMADLITHEGQQHAIVSQKKRKH